MRDKWLEALSAYVDSGEVTCPSCGGHRFKDGYVELNKRNNVGWGAFWCEDCRRALVLSRVILADEEMRKKIVAALPSDLKSL